MPKSSTQARAALPAAYQGTPFCRRLAEGQPLLAAVVEMVSVDVCALAPVIATEAGERLHVAGLLAAVGEMAQLRLTVPVKPPAGFTLSVSVFPVVAPGVTFIVVIPKIPKPGAGVTVTVAELFPAE